MHDADLACSKFWQEHLPRIKYYNPAVSTTVERNDNQAGPALLTIFFAEPSISTSRDAATAAPTQSTSGDKAPSDYAPTERTFSIDMKHKHESAILEELMKAAEGQPVEPTEAEKEELEDLQERRRHSDRDAELVKEVLAKKRKDQQVLEQARQSAMIGNV